MGPFSWVPFMECIHGLISMDHEVTGEISWNNENLNFDGGRGYIEKDRGRSMPEQWIWVHTNQFENSGDSLMLSVARIPWLGSSFTGHLGFLRYDGYLQRFGTYAGSTVSGVAAEGGLELQVKARRRTLELGLEWEGKGGSLDAPVLGSMSREIIESPRSRVVVVLRENGVLLWEGSAAPAAVEVAGDPAELL
jgi:tocopherol cyclase